ncbi:MAG: DUF4974 domain-containing protein [Chlorobi bacterium]|nr:DUF4974 domain-containing protein [Chlorobiota bacterium]
MYEQFSKFIDNPYFIKWIFDPDPSVGSYWEEYMNEHNEDRKIILQIKQELSQLKLHNKKLSDTEKVRLFQEILLKRENSAKLNKVRRLGVVLLRYAAIAIIFLFIGGGGVYLFLHKQMLQYDFVQNNINESFDSPRLVMSDGTDVELKKESTIIYNGKNEVIVDNKKLDLSNGDTESSVVVQTLIPYGSHSKIILDDSTVVYLNAGSKLIHPSRFEGKKREVVLFGEAYFDVSKNPEKPFIVKTSSLSIKVLGTKFNVSSYPEDNYIQTVLEEGSVSVMRNNSSLFEKEILLKPNQMLLFNKESQKSKIEYANIEFYTLWKEGLLKFKDQDLSRVIKQLERYYNITIKFGDPFDGLIKISGKLDLNGSRKEVFEYISIVSHLQITQYGKNYYMIK